MGCPLWGPPYRSIHALKENSTLVVLSSIDGLATTYYGETSTGDQVGPFYVFRLNVISFIKGSGPQSIYLDAGPNRPDIPLPESGQALLLFLRVVSSSGCAPSPPAPPCILPPTPFEVTYISTGGPQGRFLVQNGLVYGFKTLYPQLDNWIVVDARGIPVSQFMAEVENA